VRLEGLCQRKNPMTPPGIQPATFQFVAQNLNHCAKADSKKNEYQEYFLGGKGGWCLGLKTLPFLCTYFLEIWKPPPAGTLRACPGLYRDCLTLFYSKRLSARCNKSFLMASQALRKLTFRHDPVLTCESDRLTPGFTQFFSTLRKSTWRSP
jgi:hypothetical protein